MAQRQPTVEDPENRYVGKSVRRVEDLRFLSGRGKYTDDIRFDGELHCAFVRSTHAHAVIRRIDVAAARPAKGVVAVLTGADYTGDGLAGINHQPNPAQANDITKPFFSGNKETNLVDLPHWPLALDRVRYVGEAVAVVVADTADAARDAAELVEVDYEPLPAVMSPALAMAPDAAQIWLDARRNLCFSAHYGDAGAVAGAFKVAANVVAHDFVNSRIAACHIEPRAAIGVYDAATGDHTLVSGNQGAWRLQQLLAGALKVPAERVRVISPDVGGGFGSRIGLYPEQVVVLWAAKRVGRPVRWLSTRSEGFLSDYQGRDNVTRATLGLDGDGRIIAYSVELFSNIGAHTVSFVTASNAARMIPTVYDIPAVALSIYGVMTNTVPTAPYRGAGRPEVHHVIERMLDIAARRVGLDRVEIRRRNVVAKSKLPYTNAMGVKFENGDFAGAMEQALKLADWSGAKARKRDARHRGRLSGIGASHFVLAPTGAPFERVSLTVSGAGTVDVVVGTQSSGQGHETSFAQVAADRLGVAFEAVQIRYGDTKFVKLGGGTHADRSLRYAATLIAEAATTIIDKMKPAAAALLQTPLNAIAYDEGCFRAVGVDRSVALFDVVRAIESGELPNETADQLQAQAELRARIHAHPTGAAVCEVEVDPGTGSVQITRYTAVNDVGQIVNPMIVEGQLHGGITQGIGQALIEGMTFDPGNGQVLSASFMDYGISRADDLPAFDLQFVEDPTDNNPLRIKGAGECGIVPVTSAVVNAICDALAEAGVEDLPMPATPAAIWNALKQASKAQGIV